MVSGAFDGRRLADHLQNRVVVLTAGGNAVHDDIGDRQVGGGERGFGLSLTRFGRPDLSG